MMEKCHDVQQIDFEGSVMILSVDNRRYLLPLSEVSPRLASAGDIERKAYRVSPSGYGIHWPILDEDLSIDGLLKLAEQLSQNQSNEGGFVKIE
jgi:hypothetical protein